MSEEQRMNFEHRIRHLGLCRDIQNLVAHALSEIEKVERRANEWDAGRAVTHLEAALTAAYELVAWHKHVEHTRAVYWQRVYDEEQKQISHKAGQHEAEG
ncbi:MAG: hypothetical protein K2X87_09310 [Gemmataceae bacterium]|nr:hypothetical protein [Gemmataceae bacterium]